MAKPVQHRKTYNSIPNIAFTHENDFSAVGASDWAPLAGDIGVNVGGTATSVTFNIERSSRQPHEDGTGGNANRINAEPITGNPSNGSMLAIGAKEPAVGWWRIVVTAIAGGVAQIDLSGFRTR